MIDSLADSNILAYEGVLNLDFITCYTKLCFNSDKNIYNRRLQEEQKRKTKRK